MSNTVKIGTFKDGTQIKPSANNPKFGALLLTQEVLVFSGRFINMRSRNAIMSAEIPTLEAAIAMEQANGGIPGKVVVLEYVESEVPQEIKDEFYNENEDEDVNIERFLKKTGNDEFAIELTKDGENILRFTKFDATATMQDIFVAHDNSEEASEAAVSRNEHEKSLIEEMQGEDDEKLGNKETVKKTAAKGK